MTLSRSGYCSIYHKLISTSRKQTSSTKSCMGVREGESNGSNSHLHAHLHRKQRAPRKAVLGADALHHFPFPAVVPAQAARGRSSVAAALVPAARQRGAVPGAAAQLPLLPAGRSAGRARRCPRPARGQAQRELGEAAAVPHRSRPRSECRCLTESHPEVTK